MTSDFGDICETLLQYVDLTTQLVDHNWSLVDYWTITKLVACTHDNHMSQKQPMKRTISYIRHTT